MQDKSNNFRRKEDYNNKLKLKNLNSRLQLINKNNLDKFKKN